MCVCVCVTLSVHVCTVWYLDSEKSLLSSGNSGVKFEKTIKTKSHALWLFLLKQRRGRGRKTENNARTRRIFQGVSDSGSK